MTFPHLAEGSTTLPTLESNPLRRQVLPNELEFHYAEAGQGLPLVLIHGVLGDWRTWAPQWPAFVPHFRTISYSRRFSVPNRNPEPSPHHSALAEAQDLEQLLHSWQAEPAILVGASYGAYTALALAVEAPEKIRALILVEPPMLRLAELTPEGQEAKANFDRDIRNRARDAFLQGEDERAVWLLTEGIVGADTLNNLPPQAMQRRLENLRSIRALTLSSDEFPWLSPEQLARLTMPILLLRGANTPAIHATTFQAIEQAMPQADIKIVPDAGHGAARENPDFFNEVSLEFLRRHGLLS